jgi:hypothetical protein
MTADRKPAEQSYEQRREEIARRRNPRPAWNDPVRVKIRMTLFRCDCGFQIATSELSATCSECGKNHISAEGIARANAAADARQHAPLMSAGLNGHGVYP